MTDPYTDMAIKQDRHQCEDFKSDLLNPLIDEPAAEESMDACVTAAPPPEPRFDSQSSMGMVDTASNARSMGSFSEGGDLCVTANPPPGPAPGDWQYFVDGIYSDFNTSETQRSDLSTSSAATHSTIPLELLLNAANGDSALRDAFDAREKQGEELWFHDAGCYIPTAVLALTAVFAAALIFTESYDWETLAAPCTWDLGSIFPGC